jgi:hypothetical protein
MTELPAWLHEVLALGGVLIAASWLIVRLVQVGRPREAGCSRCEHAPAAVSSNTTGIRSKRLRVLG